MSEEGDSSKISSSEGVAKSQVGDTTDSSQDEIDVKDKIPAENQNNADKNEENGNVENDKNSHSEEADDQAEDKPKGDTETGKKKDKESVKSDEEVSENEESVEEEEEDSKKKKDKKGKTSNSDADKNSNKKDKKNSKSKNDTKDDDEDEEEEEEEEKHEKSCLGDIPRIDASISRFKNDDLKLLHKLLYKEPGKTNMIKKNIRKFDGFDFAKDSDEYPKKLKEILKFESKQLKVVCEMLDLPKGEKDEENASKILDFLLEPKDSGKTVAGGRPKRTAAVKANNRGYSSHDDYSSDEKYKPRSRRDKGQRATYKEETSSSDEEFQPSDEDMNSPPRSRRGNKRKKAKSDDSEDELATPTSDESDDGSRKRKRPSRANNKSKAKTPAKRGRKPLPKKTPGRKKKKVSSDDEDELSDKKDESSSEDEPLVKKSKNSKPPTDDEIKKYVKEILEGANLEEITMKTVCQKVYAHYPDFDLAHKKDFIKATVKSLIST